jgi:hypothetical protein
MATAYRTLAIAVAIGLGVGTGAALARSNGDGDRHGERARPRSCSATTGALLDACANEVRGDFFTAKAICQNGPEDERDGCLDEAKAAREEGNDECREQRDARRDLCEMLGEERYAPDFDPANFDADFTNLTNPNPYFPLEIRSGVRNRWQYVGGDETITVEVLAKTKLIEGVTCLVVNDRVEVAGRVVEDTDDWFGQRKDGTVDYCGEISRNFEFFPGDVPDEAELVDIEGSWKAFRDGALPGTLFPGAPMVGQVYRQEWSPGNAEDAAIVLSTTYAFGSDPELDAFVPPALAMLLCAASDCAVTGEFSPLSPGGFEHKYYAAGIGLFLEVHPDSGEIAQLVACNVDPRCDTLPAP